MPDLSIPHRHMLEVGSGITAGVIAARGYWTATNVDELSPLGFARDQLRVPALVMPLYGVDGGIVSHQIRPDDPRMNDKGKPVKYETPAGSQMRLDICPVDSIREMLQDKRSDLYITEGVKKGDSAAARGLCCIALAGVWNWRGTNESGSSVELADWDKIALKGRRIRIVFDSDVMMKQEVQKALRRLAGMLKRRGATVIPIVPHRPGHTGKIGLDDFFVLGGTVSELHECANLSILAERAIVVNNRNLADVAGDGLDALVESNIPPTLFIRGGEMVRVVHDERDIPKIQTLTPAGLKGTLARSASWIRKTKDGETEVSPPSDVVEDIMAMPSWPQIPPIVAVTRAPVLAANGSLSMAPGYCPDSFFYIACKELWPVWQGDARSAAQYITGEVLADFPFASAADQSHALALMLLPIVRPAIDGSTPLHLIDAPVQGSGKSILARVCMMPTAGAEIAATPGTKDEEEWRKKIASSLLEGRSYIFLDDIDHKIVSPSLNLALTAREFNDRMLQQTKNITLPIRCVWMATTNNAELSRDIVERTVWIRLDAATERPSERKFRHPNIEAWVAENRPTIVSALCAIVGDWVRAGMPLGKARHARYPQWSSVIGGILEHAGVIGFLGNEKTLRASANTDESAWLAFMQRWWDSANADFKKASELRPLFEEDDELAGMLGAGNESSRTTRLGHLLKKRTGVVLGGLRITRSTGQTAGSISYRLQAVSDQTPLETPKPHSENENPTLGLEPEKWGLGGLGGFSHDTRVIAREGSDSSGAMTVSTPKPPKPHSGPENPTDGSDDPNAIIDEVEL